MVQRGSTCSGEKIKETLFYAAEDHGRLGNAGTIAHMYEIWQVTTQAWDGKVKGAASQCAWLLLAAPGCSWLLLATNYKTFRDKPEVLCLGFVL